MPRKFSQNLARKFKNIQYLFYFKMNYFFQVKDIKVKKVKIFKKINNIKKMSFWSNSDHIF